jgi:hypothetical protein
MNKEEILYPATMEEVNFITDKLAVVDSLLKHKIIVHFCDGYEIKKGRNIFGDRWKIINTNYSCTTCGYKLNKNERFLVKMLIFSEHVQLNKDRSKP